MFLNNNYKSNKIMSYLELIQILEKYKIYINKVLMVQILKFIDITNPNCFYIKELRLNKEESFAKKPRIYFHKPKE